jgi:factor associated with neutral sphingomyelinase activation
VVHHLRPEDRLPAVHNEVPGRLKVCSKSLVFVPQNNSLPMLKFALSDCSEVAEWTPRSFQSALAAKQELLVVTAGQTVEMLRHNLIAPFKFLRSKDSFVFSFTYRPMAECLGQAQQLLRAASLPPVEQAGMVAAINYSIQSRLSFDTCWLENIGERIVMETVGNRITPLVLNPGRVLLTNERLYFQPYNNVEPEPVTKIRLSSIVSLHCRRYLLRPQGLELQYHGHGGGKHHIYLSFSRAGDRDRVHLAMRDQDQFALKDEEDNVTLKWQHGVISNYDYLLHLNSRADRSFNDLTQYPVFPWVVADYTSATLDLDSAATYRDLSRPMGALTKERLESLKVRRDEMGQVPSYLYGSHYSCPGFVLYYLVRHSPQYMLCLQNGRFDHPDRMFNSISQTWKNVTTNQSDFKELLPEFYDTEQGGDFLCNSLGIDFGTRAHGQAVGDVALPPWAADRADFVAKLRQALESPAVSRRLHLWIDLIFGYKSSGDEANKADNMFYPLCYEGNVDLDKISDLNERYAIEVQISEFGQVPKQIFSSPHPARYTSPPACLPAPAPAPQGGPPPARWPRLRRLVRVGDHQTHREGVSALQLLGDTVISASHDSNVRLYRCSSGALERSFSARSITISSIVCPSPDTLVLACWDNSIMVYAVPSGTWRSVTPAHGDAVSCLGWARGVLASGSWDGTVKLWRCEAARDYTVRLADLSGQLDHGSPVTCLALQLGGPGGGSLAAGTREGEVWVWSLERAGGAWAMAHRLPSHARQVNCLALSPGEDRILSGGSDFGLKVFDLRTGTVVFSQNVGEEVTSVAWDGVAALVAGGRGELTYWHFGSGAGTPRHLSASGGHQGRITALAVAAGGGTVVTGGEDRRVILWRAEAGEG